MKIGFVIPSFLYGGAERVMSILCNEFVDNGHEVSLYLTEDAKTIFYPLNPRVRIVDITVDTNRSYATKIPIYIKKLSADLKNQGSEVVVSFITRTNIISIVACKLVGIPAIVSERNNPFLVPANHLWRKIRDFVYKFADGAVFQTKNARDYFSNRVIDKSIVIKNPMSEAVNEDYDYSVKENRIISVCRLDPQKNVALLIKAFHQIKDDIPSYTLHIYGEGGQRDKLTSLINELRLNGYVFLEGKTSEVVDELKRAKIFALSSDFEGLSNAVMEAMCVGTACVVTDSPSYGNRELISRGYNGYLVPCNDVDAMAEYLKKLAKDDELIKFVSMNARKLYETTCYRIIVKEWEKYIEKIVKK